MWTRNNDVSNRNMLKHFIYSSFDKLTTSLLCSLYYRYSSKSSSFFCILSFLVRATSINQTFYSATHYLAAVWLDSRHGFNNLQLITNNLRNHFINERIVSSFDVNQCLQWVTNFIAKKYTFSSQRFRSKEIIWHAHHWRN